MEKYQVLARRYRPQRFADVVGQKAIVQTLKHALEQERVAHGYLFSGLRGTGKTTLARLLAKAINCPHVKENFEPCNECSSCHNIAASCCLDVLEIDGASHRGIEDVRRINETIGFAPQQGRYKIILIDEVHMLTKEAFNALLKNLEEPPAHVKFLFATTEPHKLPPTILSRLQHFSLHRIDPEEMRGALGSIAKDLELSVEDQVFETLCELSEGSLRDCLSLFDQLIAFGEETISQTMLEDLLGLPNKTLFERIDAARQAQDFPAIFAIAEEVFSSGKNTGFFLQQLGSHYRRQLLADPSQARLLCIVELLMEAQLQLKQAPSERIFLEMVLLRLVRSEKKMDNQELVERLLEMEKRLRSTPAQTKKPVEKKKKEKPVTQQGRDDTIMRFAAKELSGTLRN